MSTKVLTKIEVQECVCVCPYVNQTNQVTGTVMTFKKIE